MTVDYHPRLGYRVWAFRMGRHLVSLDGRRVVSALPRLSPWIWQRLLYAQVLPLAATLQGLELLHASAVVLDGRTIAFSAPQGTGKTSVAAHLVAGGASLLTDDVLALELSNDGLVGSLRSARARCCRRGTQSDDRRWSSSARRRHRAERQGHLPERGRPSGAHARRPVLPQTLAGRATRWQSSASSPIRSEPLAHCFNTYVRSQERVVNQLAVCERLVESVPMFSVAIPPSYSARDVAAAVRIHAEVES